MGKEKQTSEQAETGDDTLGVVMARFSELHKKIEELANKKLDFSNENQRSYTSGKMHAYSHIWFEMKQILEGAKCHNGKYKGSWGELKPLATATD